MNTNRVKQAIMRGWDRMSDDYQRETHISTHDVHYAPLCYGESEYSLLGDVRGTRVLELACGAAQNSVALARLGARVTALDFSPKQLEYAKRTIKRESVEVGLLRADMERLYFIRDSTFDVVISSFGWEFVTNLTECFEECLRVLGDEGTLIVCTVHPLTAFEWDPDNHFLAVDNYFNPPVEVWNETDDAPERDALTYFHSVDEMYSLLTGAGFAVDRIIEPYPLDVRAMTAEQKKNIPYGGDYWERQYDRLSKVPFSIVYRASKK